MAELGIGPAGINRGRHLTKRRGPGKIEPFGGLPGLTGQDARGMALTGCQARPEGDVWIDSYWLLEIGAV